MSLAPNLLVEVVTAWAKLGLVGTGGGSSGFGSGLGVELVALGDGLLRSGA